MSLKLDYNRTRILMGSMVIRKRVNERIIKANGKGVQEFVRENIEIEKILKELGDAFVKF